MVLELVDSAFKHVMSRDARILRDEVLDLCETHGCADAENLGIKQEFNDALVSIYDPVKWEQAVLYAPPKEILNIVLRVTSKRFYDKEDKKNQGGYKIWMRGSVSGARYKGIDYLDLFKFDPKWYEVDIQFPRKAPLLSSAFYKNEKSFRKVYTAAIRWLLTDFSYTHLFMLWDLSLRFSANEIVRCMDLVEDNSKKSVDYLRSVVEREYAILRADLEERSNLTKHSKAILDSVLDQIETGESIDWDSLEEDYDQIRENDKVFSKVKLS